MSSFQTNLKLCFLIFNYISLLLFNFLSVIFLYIIEPQIIFFKAEFIKIRVFNI